MRKYSTSFCFSSNCKILLISFLFIEFGWSSPIQARSLPNVPGGPVAGYAPLGGLRAPDTRNCAAVFLAFKSIIQPAVATTYVWTALGTDANWTTALNWLPARIGPQADDLLVFDGTVVPTASVNVDFGSPETIGQLKIVNNANVTFGITGGRTLTIGNGVSGSDFTIAAGSVLTVNTPGATAFGFITQLAAGAKAIIAGKLVFTADSPTDGLHRLLGNGASSIEFLSGSVFTAQANFTGNAFGDTNAFNGTVLFRNGSRYEQLGGSTPFGTNPPNAVTLFEPTSYYYFAPSGSNPPSLSGRTYGSLEYNAGPGIKTATGADLTTIAGDLIITNGDVRLNLNGGVNLQGNVLVNGTSSLTFNPTNASNVQFSGGAAQVIGGTAASTALVVGSNSSVIINNPAGVTLQRPLILPKALALTSGKLTTSGPALLTLAENATVTSGSNLSFINGPLARRTGAIAVPITVSFPIGKGTLFRPLALNIATQKVSSVYTAEQIEGNPGQNVAPPLKRVSFRRSYTVMSSETTAGNFTGTITLSFGDADFVNVPSSLALVLAKRDGTSPWNSLGRTTSTGPDSGPGGTPVTGTLTSDTFSDFSDFALGAINDLSNTNTLSAINPLPVQLTSFIAHRQADKAVAVRWTTASEKNSAYFEIQRSFDGRAFAGVATTKARGTSSQPITYAFLDPASPVAALYYRLRQVDNDGTMAFSPVVIVGGSAVVSPPALHPNPASSSLNFIAEATMPYRVFNQLGQVLLQGTTEAGTATVVVGSLPAGLYHLELQTSTGRVVHKFAKE